MQNEPDVVLVLEKHAGGRELWDKTEIYTNEGNIEVKLWDITIGSSIWSGNAKTCSTLSVSSVLKGA